MPEIAVKSLDNRAVGKVDLPEEVFSYPYKEHLIHLAVVALRAAQRAGTHKVKGRHEVRGSGVKPYRQKGTGRSRAGSRRSPLRRGGGVVHGPHPRSHRNKLSRNEKRNALKSALSRKLLEERIMVIDSLELESHKTGAFAARLQDLGVDGKALIVDDHGNRNLMLASRNHPQVKAVDALGVNVYDVVDRGYVLFSESAIGRLSAVLQRRGQRNGSESCPSGSEE
ncbi:MAG: 50S ribosomal protein L4 [Acidobacteria bacterium]|nr:50S ribosomal protein L4 [Acidobacteriota bacterium]